MPYDDIVLEAEDKMDKAVTVLGEEFRGVRTGRASPGLVDQLVRVLSGLGPLSVVRRKVTSEVAGRAPVDQEPSAPFRPMRAR